jgi:hypothetical protein
MSDGRRSAIEFRVITFTMNIDCITTEARWRRKTRYFSVGGYLLRAVTYHHDWDLVQNISNC